MDAFVRRRTVWDPAGAAGFLATRSDQFGIRRLLSDYLIPVETNGIFYLLGGVLAIALGPETGEPLVA